MSSPHQAPASRRLGPIARWAIAGALAAYGVLAVALLPASGPPFTTYDRVSTLLTALDFAAGLALLAAGIAVATLPGTTVTVLALAGAGLAWFGVGWAGWLDGPSVVRSAGLIAPPLVLPLLFVAIASCWRTARRAPMRLAWVSLAAGLAISLGWAVARDPFVDRWCWSDCDVNAFLLASVPSLARSLDAAWWATLIVGGIVCAIASAGALVRSPTRARRTSLAVAGVLVGLAFAAYGIALAAVGHEDPLSPAFTSLFVARSAAVLVLSGAVIAGVARTRTRRRAVSRLADTIGTAPSPSTFRAALADLVGDPRLRVAYWLPTAGVWVDETGARQDAPVAPGGRVVRVVDRAGGTIAAIAFEHDDGDGADLVARIGPAARLAAENGRLDAEIRHQLAALQASRARSVAAADDARRRLERDLHDGAQQRLLALAYAIRVAAEANERSRSPVASAALRAASSITAEAMRELREIAHGIFPAILADGGLLPAVATTSDGAGLAVDLRGVDPMRHPPEAEAAAYFAVVEGIRDAEARGASFVEIAAAREGASLRVTVADDGSAVGLPLDHVVDRVGAVGGQVRLESGSPLGRRLSLEIPCASS